MSDSEYNPLEGEPSLLRSKAEHYEQIGYAILRSVATLDAIHSESDMTSKAISAIRDKSGEVSEDIKKAQRRYSQTAQALIAYSADLRSAQDAANVAIRHIGAKADAAEAASRAADTASTKAESSTGPDTTTDHTAATRAHDDAIAASGELTAAHNEWRAALEQKNTAAGVAVTAIVEVVDGKYKNGLADSAWDDWGDFIKTVCEWAGVLAIFLAWVPFLGQALLILAIIGAAITVAESFMKAMNGGSWADFGFACVGLVLTVFGGNIGKYLGKLVKAKGLTVAMKLPRKQFTALTGITRGQKGKELADVQKMLNSPKKLPNAMKEVFGKNPFSVSEKNLGAAFTKFRQNPLGISGFDNPMFASQITSEIPMGAKVALGVWNYRAVAGKVEGLTNNPFDHTDKPISLKPETVLKDLANGRLPKVTIG